MKSSKKSSPKNSKQRTSSTSDPRPIRDPNFIKDAKEKIIKLMQDTDFPREFMFSDFTKITTSQVKAIFEHFICQIYPEFRLNDFDRKLDDVKTPEDRIVHLLLNGLHYKNHLTKTHITSPSVQSSIPFVVGALDFLRRLVTVCLNTDPSQMYPISPYSGISSEARVDVLIRVFKGVESIDTMDCKAVMCDLESSMRTAFDIKSKEEIAQMSANVDMIEQLHTEIAQLEQEIEITRNRTKKQCELLQKNVEEHNQLQQELKLISEEILDIESDLDCLIKEEMNLEQRKDKFEELGYTEQIKQIDDLEENIDKIRTHYRQLKIERDENEMVKRRLNNEMNNARFEVLNGFKDVFQNYPHLINNEMRKILTDLKIDDLIKFEVRLQPHLKGLIESLEKEIQRSQECLDERMRNIEIMQQEFETLSREITSIESEKRALKEEESEIKAVVESLHVQRLDIKAKKQDYIKQINKERSELKLLDETVLIMKNQFEEKKEWKEQARQFYDVDLEFEKELAEIRLQSLQDGFELRQSLKKENQQRLDEWKKFIDMNEIELENLETNIMECYKKEFEK